MAVSQCDGLQTMMSVTHHEKRAVVKNGRSIYGLKCHLRDDIRE